MHKEKTLVLIKPDAVQRGLTGEIITRFEKVGLKIVAMKMIKADQSLGEQHYELDPKWAENLFGKISKSYEEKGTECPFKDAQECGKYVQGTLVNFLKSGPCVALVLEGLHAVKIVRKLVGNTDPYSSAPGTIRGDYSMESYEYVNKVEKVMANLIHASGEVEEAEREIGVWFPEGEGIFDYSHALEEILYNPKHFE